MIRFSSPLTSVATRTDRARILLADDHTLLVDAFTTLLSPEFDIVGTVGDGRALVDAAARLKPEAIVLDISMPLLNGLDAGRQVKQMDPSVKLVYVTMTEDPDLAVEAFRIGASAFLLKRSAASELVSAIREALQGRLYVTSLVTKDLVGTFLTKSEQAPRTITPRQREVLQLLAEGHSMKQVASLLNMTTRTVAFHKYRMMEQLQIGSTAELIQFAIRHHIV